MSDFMSQEKDLVLLLGSFLLYKEFVCLYELIAYVKSYSSDDLINIIGELKKCLPKSVIEWFADFLSIVNEKTSILTISSLLEQQELIPLVVQSSPELVNYFVDFWGE